MSECAAARLLAELRTSQACHAAQSQLKSSSPAPCFLQMDGILSEVLGPRTDTYNPQKFKYGGQA